MKLVATSYATLKDLRNYIRCLLRGGSETHCYDYGDNGTGAWGDNTAQLDIAYVALSPALLRAQWGSSDAGRKKWLRVRLLSLTAQRKKKLEKMRKAGKFTGKLSMIMKKLNKLSSIGHGNWVKMQVGDKGPGGKIDINPAGLQLLGLPIDAELSANAEMEWI